MRAAFEPGEALAVPFAFELPATLPAGRSLYLRARLDERTAALHEVRLPEAVAVELDGPDRWSKGDEGTIRALVRNVGDERLDDVRVEVRSPFALRHGQRVRQPLGDLEPGEERELVWRAHAVAPLDSGSLQVSVATANGGGAVAHRHLSVPAARRRCLRARRSARRCATRGSDDGGSVSPIHPGAEPVADEARRRLLVPVRSLRPAARARRASRGTGEAPAPNWTVIDVDHPISAVERVIGDRVLEAGAARVLTASQVFDARLGRADSPRGIAR